MLELMKSMEHSIREYLQSLQSKVFLGSEGQRDLNVKKGQW